MAKSRRYGSRSAKLPTTKDVLDGDLKDGLDAIGEALMPARWKIRKGDKRSIWVAGIDIKGDWKYGDLREAFEAIQDLEPIDNDRLCFFAFHFTEKAKKRGRRKEGWLSVGAMSRWGDAVARVLELTDPEDEDSWLNRYEETSIDQIEILLASRLKGARWLED